MDDLYTAANTCEWPTTVFLEMDLDAETSEKLGGDYAICTGAYVGDGAEDPDHPTQRVTVSNFETIVTTHACNADPDLREVWTQRPSWR